MLMNKSVARVDLDSWSFLQTLVGMKLKTIQRFQNIRRLTNLKITFVNINYKLILPASLEKET